MNHSRRLLPMLRRRLWSGSFLLAAAAAGPVAAELPAPAVVRGEPARAWRRLLAIEDVSRPDEAARLADELVRRNVRGWVAVDDARYVGFRSAVHERIATFAPAALEAYRGRIDAIAGRWYQRGIALRDATLLRRVIRDARHSRWGDAALWAYGELKLEQGHYQAARNAWLQSLDVATFDQGEVRARLALVSIRSGNLRRAEQEAATLAAEFPQSEGRLAGRTVVFADAVAELLAAAVSRASLPDARPDAGTDVVDEPASESPTNKFQIRGAAVVRRNPGGDAAQTLIDFGPRGDDPGAGAPDEPAAVRFAVDGDRLFAVCVGCGDTGDDPQLVGLDLARDGALFFQHRLDAAVQFASKPAVVGDLLLVMTQSVRTPIRWSIAAYDFGAYHVEGQREPWRLDLAVGGALPRTGEILAVDQVVYVGSSVGFVAALDAIDGEPLWLRTFEPPAEDERPFLLRYLGTVVSAGPLDGPRLVVDAATGLDAPSPASGSSAKTGFRPAASDNPPPAPGNP